MVVGTTGEPSRTEVFVGDGLKNGIANPGVKISGNKNRSSSIGNFLNFLYQQFGRLRTGRFPLMVKMGVENEY